MRLKLRNSFPSMLAAGICTVAAALSDASAQGPVTGRLQNSIPVCALAGPARDGVESYGSPSPESLKVMNWITEAIGIEMNFEVVRATFSRSPTAFAVISRGKRYVVYDQERLTLRDGEASWFSVGVLAHEIGHHIQGHTAVTITDDWTQELEADRFSGFVVGKLGGTLKDALMMTAGFSAQGSSTHPPKGRRVNAVTEGWRLAAKSAPKTCSPGWQSETFNIDGNACRIAEDCLQGQAVLKAACQDYDGVWRWK